MPCGDPRELHFVVSRLVEADAIRGCGRRQSFRQETRHRRAVEPSAQVGAEAGARLAILHRGSEHRRQVLGESRELRSRRVRAERGAPVESCLDATRTDSYDLTGLELVNSGEYRARARHYVKEEIVIDRL